MPQPTVHASPSSSPRAHNRRDRVPPLSGAGQRLARIICHLRDDLAPQRDQPLPDHAAIYVWTARSYHPRLANLPWEEATFELLHQIRQQARASGEPDAQEAEPFALLALDGLRRVTPYSFLWKH